MVWMLVTITFSVIMILAAVRLAYAKQPKKLQNSGMEISVADENLLDWDEAFDVMLHEHKAVYVKSNPDQIFWISELTTPLGENLHYVFSTLRNHPQFIETEDWHLLFFDTKKIFVIWEGDTNERKSIGHEGSLRGDEEREQGGL